MTASRFLTVDGWGLSEPLISSKLYLSHCDESGVFLNVEESYFDCV